MAFKFVLLICLLPVIRGAPFGDAESRSLFDHDISKNVVINGGGQGLRKEFHIGDHDPGCQGNPNNIASTASSTSDASAFVHPRKSSATSSADASSSGTGSSKATSSADASSGPEARQSSATSSADASSSGTGSSKATSSADASSGPEARRCTRLCISQLNNQNLPASTPM